MSAEVWAGGVHQIVSGVLWERAGEACDDVTSKAVRYDMRQTFCTFYLDFLEPVVDPVMDTLWGEHHVR
jgi:hypothetical protein